MQYFNIVSELQQILNEYFNFYQLFILCQLCSDFQTKEEFIIRYLYFFITSKSLYMKTLSILAIQFFMRSSKERIQQTTSSTLKLFCYGEPNSLLKKFVLQISSLKIQQEQGASSKFYTQQMPTLELQLSKLRGYLYKLIFVLIFSSTK
ncbi:hypothetical protein ABPG72_014318 [Tetrahymena utriculariae]